MEHPVKTKDDFKILQYINENMVVKPKLTWSFSGKIQVCDQTCQK